MFSTTLSINFVTSAINNKKNQQIILVIQKCNTEISVKRDLPQHNKKISIWAVYIKKIERIQLKKNILLIYQSLNGRIEKLINKSIFI